MMKLIKYVSTFIIIVSVGILYDKYKSKYLPDEELAQIDMVNRHLLGDNGYNIQRPILWIHSDDELRQRKSMNGAYIECCKETIIKHCGESFNICLIDDTSFKKLIPEWNIEIKDLASPLKEKIRLLAISKVIYKYGGMVLPETTIVLKDLLTTYNNGIKETGVFIGNIKNNSNLIDDKTCYPNKLVVGAIKNNNEINNYIKFLEILVSKDYTSESDFTKNIEKYLSNQIVNKKINSICSQVFGSKSANGKAITVDELMSDKNINYSCKTVCIVISKEDLVKRRQYGWFLKLSKKEIFECNSAIAKFIVFSQTQ